METKQVLHRSSIIDLNNIGEKEKQYINLNGLGHVFRCYICGVIKTRLEVGIEGDYFIDGYNRDYVAYCKICHVLWLRTNLDESLLRRWNPENRELEEVKSDK